MLFAPVIFSQSIMFYLNLVGYKGMNEAFDDGTLLSFYLNLVGYKELSYCLIWFDFFVLSELSGI